MSRGLRNNNPGNIRLSKTKYLGEVPSTDSAFKQFKSIAWGYRAMFVLLFTYQKKYNCNTLREIISRYAPPNENHTENYIEAVSDSSGVWPDVKITTTNRDIMVPVVAAMSRVENEVSAVMDEVNKGWELFQKHKP